MVFYSTGAIKKIAPIGWKAYFGSREMASVQPEDRGFVMNATILTSRRRFDWTAIARNSAFLLCMTGLLCLVAPMARADEEKDPPTRVARLSYIDGTVSLQPGGDGEWGSAAKNRPVTIGDKIWVDKDSRAELQAGQAAIHLGSMTALSFLNLDANITQMRLAEGSVNFRVRELREGDLYEVDAPNLAFTIRQAGAFRIDVDESGEASRVTVFRGEGEVTAGGKTYEVHSGERAEFNGMDNIEYSVDRAPGPDGLDRWANERDLKEDNSVSAKYVSRDMVGYSDLDDHGTWSEEPEYGHVWYPNEVAADWAPYSTGYWNWVGPWGWTWVDYSPWGFAPFHYGRWSYIGSRWGWCPGPFFGPPIYGPAFVGFLGGGFGFGVGWFPLGFGEPFFPWFSCGRGFRERINFRNTFIRDRNIFNTNIRNVNFVNAHNVRAVTVANRNTFVNGQSINRGASRVTAASLRGANVTNSVGLRPTQHSSLGAANVNSRVARPSAAVQNRGVMARTAPAQGASNLRVHTVDSGSLTPGRAGNARGSSTSNRPANGAMNQRAVTPTAPAHNGPAMNGRPGALASTSAISPRQRDLSQNRPPSAMGNSQRMPNSTLGNNPPQRAGNSPRAWEAQRNSTDRGRTPAGFGGSNRPANAPAQSERMPRSDRPSWAGRSDSGANGPASRATTPNNSRSNYSNGGRSYEPPQRTNRDTPSYNNNRGASQPRSYNPPPSRSYNPAPPRSDSAPRTYSAPSRSYPAPSRSYSAPSRSYSAPSRSYSAPSRSYSAPSRSNSAPSRGSSGGGGNRGGGGSPRGGGSVSNSHH